MGFWTKTPQDNIIHISGNKNMSDHALSALHTLIDKAQEMESQKRKDFYQLWNSAPDRLKKMDYEAAFEWFEIGFDLAEQRRPK